ncbi:hypothetical protein [Limosilactobacillus allomucosae]|uniref:hypothetical protein n=1 Tax=Limosilactobacillus allomucosae TaxID=3142938 RepID=UPI003267B143
MEKNRQEKGKETSKYDAALLRIQGDAFIVMIITVLAFFPCRHMYPQAVKYIVCFFILAAIVGFGIGFVWLKRDYQEFKRSYLKVDKSDKKNKKDI